MAEIHGGPAAQHVAIGLERASVRLDARGGDGGPLSAHERAVYLGGQDIIGSATVPCEPPAVCPAASFPRHRPVRSG